MTLTHWVICAVLYTVIGLFADWLCAKGKGEPTTAQEALISMAGWPLIAFVLVAAWVMGFKKEDRDGA